MEEDDYFKKLILEESDQCRGPKSDMQLVFCRRVKPETEDDLIHNETVTDLKPSTTYRFDLFASKPQRQAISYRTVWVKTRGDCGSDSSDN